MGKILQKTNNKHNSKNQDSNDDGLQNIHGNFCPLCRVEFDEKLTIIEIQEHVDYCLNDEITIKNVNQKGSKPKEMFKTYVKFGKDPKVKFSYSGEKMISPYSNIPFEKKLQLLKNNIKSIKVDWREGCCTLKLTRDKLLEESITQLGEINIYKELKINFKGEVSHDAGGIIREWFTIIFKELQSEKRRKVYAKAVLENITINSCLNKIFFKVILNEKITLNDLVFIDKTLYNSLRELQNSKDYLDDMELYFVVNYEKNGIIFTEELIEQGAKLQVTKDNLEVFIEKKIEFLIKKDLVFYNEFRSSFLSVIIENYVCFFNSDELELIINGQPFIDVEDWKGHTIYQGIYKDNHNVIKWFWEIIFKLEQDELSKFLQFCTGTSRVPLGGFSVLESNRGEISKFCIVSIDYNKNQKNNFIKAHTCFNRIDLPIYPIKKHLEEAFKFIIQNEILGFGID